MKNLIYIASFLAIFISCASNNNPELPTYPECIKAQISNLEKYYLANPTSVLKSKIDKYNYKGQVVYFIDNHSIGDADSTSLVVNSNCETLCLIGGIDGSQNDCIDWSKAKFIETIWKK